jgi:hypothetical protein
LGRGKPIPLKQMIQTIEKNLGTTAHIKQKPLQPGDVKRTSCDWSKAHKLLGYKPKTDFEKGIQKFLLFGFSSPRKQRRGGKRHLKTVGLLILDAAGQSMPGIPVLNANLSKKITVENINSQQSVLT